MTLKVINCVSTSQMPGPEAIHVAYVPQTELTTITVNCDLVTLGIAVEVLTQQYNETLEQFAPTAQEQIIKTIKEAVKNAEN